MDIKFLKRNKFTLFVIIFFLILLILMLQVKNLFFPSGRDANYGDRLDGIVEVHQDTLDAVSSKLRENEKVVDAKVRVEGRIVSMIITVLDTVSLSEAREISNATPTLFEEAILNDYDLQVYLKKESKEENDFPIIGYKAKKSSAFSYTKDRAKTVEEGSES